MIGLDSQARIWLCTEPTDMRKSFRGLSALVQNQLKHDPLSGQYFVFVNRRKTQMKMLYFTTTGYCLWAKRLEFGPKSEKQVFDLPGQDSLFASDDAPVPAQPPKNEKRTVKAYQRGTGKKQRDDDCLNDTGLRFTADVPVEVIEHLPPELTA